MVPIGDLLLFYNYDACINLGGFSNISKTILYERVAYDICPVNIVKYLLYIVVYNPLALKLIIKDIILFTSSSLKF